MQNLTSIYQETLSWATQNEIPMEAQPVTTSTNDLAKAQTDQPLPALKLYLADQQTAGRGQHQRRWESPPSGHALLSTWSYAVEQAPQPISTPLFGWALFATAQQTWPNLKWSLKAPNDLYLDAYKIAGLLLEVVSKGPHHRLLVGLGINIFSHPLTIPEATHLTSEHGTANAVDPKRWHKFLQTLHANFSTAVAGAQKTELSSKVRDALLLAINANPHKKQTYLEITALGELVSEGNSTPWH